MKRISWLLLVAVVLSLGVPMLSAQTITAPAPSGTVQPTPPAPPPLPPPPPAISEEGIRFQNTSLQTVVEALAASAKLRIIIPETLAGSITMNLPGVDAKTALRTVLDSKNFILVEGKDGIFTVQAKAAEEPEVKAFTLSYSNVKDMTPAVKTMLTARGKLEVTGNTLIVSDVPSNLTKIEAMMKDLDTKTPQVQIETRMYEVTRSPTKDLGVDWSNTLNGGTDRAGGLDTRFGGGAGASKLTDIAPFIFNFGNNVTRPTSAVLAAKQFSAVLRFLNSDTDTELIATPRIVTADNKEAIIKIVKQEPIPQFRFNQQTAAYEISGFDYKDIGNTLKVTPHVNKDGFITLDVEPMVSSSNESRDFAGSQSSQQQSGGTSGTGGSSSSSQGGSGLAVRIPVISTRTVSTRVVLKNGDTLAIGGLITTDKTNAYTKVPVIGDVPVLGMFFRSKYLRTEKRNLLLFVTPTEIPAGGKTGFEDQAEGLKQGEVYVDDVWMPRDNAKPANRMSPRQEDLDKGGMK
jgi:type IV pilus assembly protein PilQ